MNYSLKLICNALNELCVLGGDKAPVIAKIVSASETIKSAIADMDTLTVQGRGSIDTLLGCMMTLEAIVGKEEGNA